MTFSISTHSESLMALAVLLAILTFGWVLFKGVI